MLLPIYVTHVYWLNDFKALDSLVKLCCLSPTLHSIWYCVCDIKQTLHLCDGVALTKYWTQRRCLGLGRLWLGRTRQYMGNGLSRSLPHCMKSEIFISMQHCRLTWNFRFATTRGSLQATPKTAMNCRKLTWALFGSCPPMTPLPLILVEALTFKWKCCKLYKCKPG